MGGYRLDATKVNFDTGLDHSTSSRHTSSFPLVAGKGSYFPLTVFEMSCTSFYLSVLKFLSDARLRNAS